MVSLPVSVANVVSAVTFGGYLILVLVVAAVYAVVTILQRRSFWVAARSVNQP